MDSHLQAVTSRIQEIEARLGMLGAPAAPTVQPSAAVSAGPAGLAAAVKQPFDVLLAQANGAVRLRTLGPAAGPFSPNVESLIARYSAQNGLSPDLVRAVVQQESGGDTKSHSAAGAQGLMQLMPETAQGYGVKDAYDPEQNIAAGTRHLAGLLREFNGDIPKALAAYNAGSGAVRKYGGVPPFAETQDYVRKITGMIGAR